MAACSQPQSAGCVAGGARTAGMAFRLDRPGNNCLRVTGGFLDNAGSFAGLSLSSTNPLGLGETLEVGAQYGVRLRRIQFGLTKPFQPGKRLEAGFTVHGQRFNYDQGRDASILAFSRDVSQFEPLDPDNLLRYFSHSYGGSVFVRLAVRRFSHAGMAYSYNVTGVKPSTPAASDYFGGLDFLNASSTNRLSGIRTSKVTASYTYNTVDRPIGPTRGATLSAAVAVAGLGGDVNTIEPAIDVKWFHPGPWRHVIAAHLHGSMLTGYGGKAAPTFDRYYMGGEDEVRGFASWSVSPIAYVPGAASIPVLNDDGTPRINRGLVDGVPTSSPVTMTIPVYRPVSTGGDTKAVGNVEYAIPLIGSLTLAIFTDAGVDRTSYRSQFQLNAGVIQGLNAQFPESRPLFQPGSQKVRMSSGVELQALAPKIHAPVRMYWAYNLLRCGDPGATVAVDRIPPCNNVTPPFVAGQSFFPNLATFQSARAKYGMLPLLREPRSMLRLAVGFSF